MRRRQAALLLGAALLFVLAFPPLPTGALAWFCLVPFWQLLADAGYRRGFALGYLFGFVAIGALLHWLAWNTGASAPQSIAMWLSATVYLAFAWGMYGLAQGLVCRRFGERGLLAAPFLWTAAEFVQSDGELGFGWHSLASTQTYYTPLIQFASVTGMFGITFWVVSLNVVAYLLWRRWRAGAGWRGARRLVVAAALLVALPLGHGLVALAGAPAADDAPRRARVALVQPNIDSVRKFAERSLAYQELMTLTAFLDDPPYDLVIWPETAVPLRLRELDTRVADIRAVLRPRGATLLAGVPDRREVAAGTSTAGGRADRVKRQGFRDVNAVLRIGAAGELASYEKLHLVPFGEYVPASLSFMEDMMLNAGSGIHVPGERPVVFDVPLNDGGPPLKVAPLICLEALFPRLVNRFVDEGAELIAVLVNDDWYAGTPQPFQHARVAVLRAIEHRLPVARVANSGISLFVDPYGRVTAASGSAERAVLVADVPLRGERSLYSRAGDWFPFGVLGLSVLALLALIGDRIRRRSA